MFVDGFRYPVSPNYFLNSPYSYQRLACIRFGPEVAPAARWGARLRDATPGRELSGKMGSARSLPRSTSLPDPFE